MAKYTSELEAQSAQFGESLDQEAQGLFYVTSAGFSNAGAMKVLGQAVEDAKAGHVDLSIAAKGLDAALNAYGASADQATQYNDYMITAVTKGVQTFGDFASAVSKAAIAGHAAHISFNQVAAAESELTTVGMTARQASMDLSSMMKALDNDADKTAATAHKLGLHFDEAKFKTMDLFHQMLYLQDVTKGNQTELTKLTGGSAGIAAFNGLMTKNADGTYKFAQSLDNMKHSTGAAAQAFQTSQETISAHMEKINAAFSVISYKALEAIAPAINMVADAVGRAADFMSQHMDIMMPILAGLAAFLGVILVAAIGALAVAIWTVASPFIIVGAIIGAVVAGIVLAVEHWGDIMKQVNAVAQNPVIAWILSGLQQLGSYLASVFVPVWNELVAVWKNQIVPAFSSLQPVVEPLKMLLGALAMIVGVILVVALGVVIGLITALAKGFAGLLIGVAQIVGGIIQIVGGLVQFVSGILAVIVDIFTGQWGKIGSDLLVALYGILNIFGGFGNILAGIFWTIVWTVWGIVSGFVEGIIGFFMHLFDALVGHSIVPDMVNAIINWFEQLPGKALQWGADMINNFASGITNMIGNITSACSNVASEIASWLHFSVPEKGPLSTSDQWMNDFGNQLSAGLNDQQGKVKASSDNVAGAITNSDLSKLGNTAKQIVKSFGDIAKGIDKVFGPINKSLGDLDKLGNHLDGMAKASQKTVDAFNKLGGAIKDSTKPVNDTEKVFGGLKDSLDKAFNAISDAAPKFKKLEPTFKDLQKPIQDASSDLKKVGDAIANAMKPVNDALKHLDSLEKSTGKISQNAKDTTKAMFSDVRLGKVLDMDRCLHLVAQVTASILRDSSALTSIVRLKIADDYTYMHSVAVCTLMVALGRTLGMDEVACKEGLGYLLMSQGNDPPIGSSCLHAEDAREAEEPERLIVREVFERAAGHPRVVRSDFASRAPSRTGRARFRASGSPDTGSTSLPQCFKSEQG